MERKVSRLPVSFVHRLQPAPLSSTRLYFTCSSCELLRVGRLALAENDRPRYLILGIAFVWSAPPHALDRWSPAHDLLQVVAILVLSPRVDCRHGNIIFDQLERLTASLDDTRYHFTMDD